MKAFAYIAGNRAIYLRYTLVTCMVVLAAASFQMFHFLEHPQPKHFVVPVILSLVLGALVSTIAALRNDALAQEQMFRSIADLAQEFTYVRRNDGIYDYVSPSCLTITGHSPQDFYATRNFMAKLIVPDDREIWARHVHRMREDGHPEKMLIRIRRPEGGERWLEHVCGVLRDEGGNIIGTRSTNLDVTERIRHEQELAIAATAFETHEAILITDPQGHIERVNRAFTEITGYPPEEVIGKTPAILKSGRHDAAFYADMWHHLLQDGHWSGEVWDRRRNGEIYPKQLAITAVRDGDGTIVRHVGSFSDISERKRAEDEINRLAYYDPLTELPNRRLLMDRLRQALSASERHTRHGALMLLDLDHFKTLNDTRGHEAGDLLLKEVARRLLQCVRAEDTVARLGGDEFVLMLEDLGKDEAAAAAQVETVAEKILESIRQPFALKDGEYHGSSSIGITLFLGQGEPVDDILKHADVALYRAKEAGRNTSRFYDPAMQTALDTRATLEADLRNALFAGQLHLYYQPQVDSSKRMVGAEVLIRWQHPQRGLVPPNEFIPFAEESGLILPIGRWVLETAVRQLHAWGKSPRTASIQLAVNVSPRQFQQSGFVDELLQCLEREGVDPRRLKIELTESMLLDSIDETIAKLELLKAAGIGISLDDFGTGYSSLSYLKRLPIDQLKIDRSFVSDVATNINDAVIVQTIIGMTRNLGLHVIAEGVEDAEQVDLLERNGCTSFQGYYFSRPVPLAEFENLLPA